MSNEIINQNNSWWIQYLKPNEEPLYNEDDITPQQNHANEKVESNSKKDENVEILPEEQLLKQIEELAPNGRCITSPNRVQPLVDIAANPNCPPDIFDKLLEIRFTQQDSERRFYSDLLESPKLSEEKLLKIAISGTRLSTYQFTRFENCPSEVLSLLSQNLGSYDQSDIVKILKHPCCNESVLETMAENGNLNNDERYWDNENNPALLFIKMLDDENCSPNLFKSIIKGSLQESYDRYRDRTNYEVIKPRLNMILAHPRMTDEYFHTGLEIARFGNKSFQQQVYKTIVQNKAASAQICSEILEKAKSIPQFADELSKIIASRGLNIKEKTEKQKNNFLNHLCSEDCQEKDIAAFVTNVHQAIQSGEADKIEKIKDLLFSGREEDVFIVDHKIMEWFVNNGTTENLSAVNDVRSLYGLKTVIEEFSHEDSDIVDAKRIRFSGSLSAMGTKNPHYTRKHTQAFLNYTPDYSADFKTKDYDLSQNEALQKAAEEGIIFPKDKLKEIFVEGHIPPQLVQKFNLADFSQLLVENSEGYVDEERGLLIDFSDFQTDVPKSIREQFWMKAAQNEELVAFVSQDLQKKGIPEGDIKQLWENALDTGSPCHNSRGFRNVYGVSLQVHHRKALKDGGQNQMDNFMIVVNLQGEVVFVDENVVQEIRNEGIDPLDSHAPLHEYDNPLVFLYQKKDGTISQNQTSDSKRIKVLTYPTAPCGKNENILYYGGPGQESCCVGSIEGRIHGVVYDVGKRKKETVTYKDKTEGR